MEQTDGIRHSRAREDLFETTCLDHRTGVHHRHSIAEFGDDTEIVSNQKNSCTFLIPEITHQFQNLCLNCHI